MAKDKTIYVCTACGAVSPKWLGKCPSCDAWNSYVEDFSTPKVENHPPKMPTTRTKLADISTLTTKRISSTIKELDRVLGGGIVPSSLVLIGGEPGIGKSTLLTEVALSLSNNYNVLYISAEESLSQIKLRCSRLNIAGDNMLIMNENVVEQIENSLEGIDFLIVDSIQAVYLESLNSTAGSVSQIRECASRFMNIAKNKKITTFIVGHVTKEGAIAGPKVLEHVMDTVLYFEGENTENYRLLRSVKNRFGATNEVGVFEMTDSGIFGVKDYNGIFISATRGNDCGSIVTPSISGNRCVPVEIQSLVSKTPFGMPRRMSLGIDYNKMILLTAVCEKKAGIPFYNEDVYLNAMGGIKLNEPSIDLAIVLSLVSSHNNIIIEREVACFGEVGLTGEVRGVNFAEKRIVECINLGFKKIILPYYNFKALKSKYENKIKLLGVSYVYQAVKLIKEMQKDG